MSSWSARTTDGSFSLVIEAGALRDLDRMCAAAGNVETGGVLVGRYSADLTAAIVLEVTPPPPDSQQGSSWFNRGIAGLRAMLRRRWRSKERTYYVGEWHFHPAAHIEPSEEDIAQMYRICHDPNYHCGEPVLLILGRLSDGEERAARAFVFPLGERHMELVHVANPHEASFCQEVKFFYDRQRRCRF